MSGAAEAPPGAWRGVPVLVTGAAGFIGSHLVRRLLAEGARVHALDRPGAPRDRLAGAPGDLSWHGLDLAERAAVAERVRRIRPRCLFHLAAHTQVARGFEPLDDALGDLRAALDLARLAAETGAGRFVYTGTCEEYGDLPAPFVETQPPNPVSAYSAAKAAGTLFCRMFHRTAGLPVVIVRPFLTYGPGQDPGRFLSRCFEAALTGTPFAMTRGEQTREFNYVDDIVDGFVRAAAAPGAAGEIINLGNGVEVTLREAVERVGRATGRTVPAQLGALPYRPGETMHFYCDASKARRLLGWAPRVGLDEGLRRTWAWYARAGRPAGEGGAP